MGRAAPVALGLTMPGALSHAVVPFGECYAFWLNTQPTYAYVSGERTPMT